MRRIKPLIEALKELSENHEVKPVNIALRYLIDKGAVPIVGVKNKNQVEDLLKTFEFKLTSDETKYLNDILNKIKLVKWRAVPHLIIRLLKG